ncbi:hypothetical protein [Lentibacillus amyloliquefaciens]|uniref:Uncharacterized protein n=1 Tax=Lentibacillus amyloliquefaciens TaxID=1472767 RepID=A0A0U4F4N8_9BACI|nr:hypothetical protein [Lentibacillus amyloliquefaciens]ALX47731.1 hypothetical protein AOX59_03390 [Lentibacillus amyloliquefaciens]
MLKKSDVPNIVAEALSPYEKEKKESTFLPLRVYYKGQYYFFFTVTPPIEYVVIREDGIVPFYDDAKVITLTANGFDTMNKNLNSIGKEWLNSSAKMLFYNLIDTLERLKQKLVSSMPDDVYQSLNSFIEMAKRGIHEQEIIEETVKEGLNYTESVYKKGILTKEDADYLEQNKDETMRAMSRKNLIQMETYEERKKVISFIWKKIWTKPYLLFDLLLLLRYQINLRSNKDRKAAEARKLINRIEEGKPSAEHEETKNNILQSILNPKT